MHKDDQKWHTGSSGKSNFSATAGPLIAWDSTAGMNSTLTFVHYTSQFTEHPGSSVTEFRGPSIEEETEALGSK